MVKSNREVVKGREKTYSLFEDRVMWFALPYWKRLVKGNRLIDRINQKIRAESSHLMDFILDTRTMTDTSNSNSRIRDIFPGYVFVKMMAKKELIDTLSTVNGLRKKYDGSLIFYPLFGMDAEKNDTSVEELTKLLQLKLGKSGSRNMTVHKVQKNDLVTITKGIFRDRIGKVKRVDEANNLVIMKLDAGNTELSMSLDSVTKKGD